MFSRHNSVVYSLVIGVSVVAVFVAAVEASGQILNEAAKLLASDGAAGDDFGVSSAVSGDVALVGAQSDDDNGTDSGSAYVFRWNGSSWVQEQKLLVSDGAANDRFGYPLSVSGDVAVVGARLDDDNGTDSGSAYVFRWNGSSWVQEQKLLPSDGAANDAFGWALSVSGDVAVVGAPLDGDNGFWSGSAYVFRWNGSSWVQEQKLLPSDGKANEWFGFSVSVSGDVALVGADEELGSRIGSAYVFRWNGSSWAQEQKLLASDGVADDIFGVSVSVSGDVAVVGAYQDDDNGTNSGSAYVFRWNGSSWAQEQKLLASDGAGGDDFARSVSVSGAVAVVGAYLHDDNGTDSGSAYVFRWNGSSWAQEQELLASDGAAGDLFSYISVSVSGDIAFVGAPRDDDNGTDSGSAYVFDLICAPDYYNYPTCTFCQAATTCSGNGICNPMGACNCNVGFVGTACDQCALDYYNYPVCTYCLAGTTCSGHGTCNSLGACDCNTGYAGPTCDQCQPGYYGPMCMECPCGGATPCSGHGVCDDGISGSGLCTCDPVYVGDCCEQCQPGYYEPMCLECPGGATTPCNGHGDCDDGITGTGVCVCYTGWAGEACDQCAGDAVCEDSDVCTWDRCLTNDCWWIPNRYGDVNGNGFITLADLFCVLKGFAGDFTECSFEQDDIHGSCGIGQPPCCPNGVISLADLFAVLNAFAGIDPCCGG